MTAPDCHVPTTMTPREYLALRIDDTDTSFDLPLVLTKDERPITLSHTFWDACSIEPS